MIVANDNAVPWLQPGGFFRKFNMMAVAQATAGVALGVSGVLAGITGRAQTGFLNAARNGVWAVVHRAAGMRAQTPNGLDIINRRVNSAGAGVAAATNLPQAIDGLQQAFQTASANTDLIGGGLAVTAYSLMSADQYIKQRRLSRYFKNHAEALPVKLDVHHRNRILGYGRTKLAIFGYGPLVILMGRAINFTYAGADEFVRSVSHGNDLKTSLAAAFLTVSGALFVFGAYSNIKRKTDTLRKKKEPLSRSDEAPDLSM